jgi:flagellar basal-body rod protein FlgG
LLSFLILPTVNSGNAQAADDFKLVSGALEGSNVQIADEMVTMMMAQRAYELGSRAIRTADEMLGMANALLRR